MKTKLLQLMALGAMMLVPIGVGAQSFGTDDVIGTTTLWTFDQYQANDQIPDGNFAGLYIKSHEASTKPNKAGLSVCTSTFGDKTVYTLNYCALEGGYTSSMKTSDIKERKASTTIKDCISLNINTPGTLYLTASANAKDKTVDIFKGNTGNITDETEISSLKIASFTSENKYTVNTISATISEAGTYWITSNGPFRIYAIKFVPTIEGTPNTKTITMSNMGLMTFSDTHAWTLPSGLKAYATRSAVKDGKMTFREITGTIPACMGVILQGTHNQEYTLTLSDVSSWNFNKVEDPRYIDINYCFRPVLIDYALQSTYVSTQTWNNYILAKDGENMVLAQSSGVGSLAAGKAYFSIRTDQIQTTSGSRNFILDFNDEGTTGINATLNNNEVKNNVYFNLNGQRVAQPTKGMYIVNGKKVIIK